MSNGYTAGVEDGSVTELPVFAMECVRAIDYLIEMKEQPPFATIKDRAEPASFYADQLRDAEQAMTEHDEMAREEIERRAEDEYLGAVDRWKDHARRKEIKRRRGQGSYKGGWIPAQNLQRPKSNLSKSETRGLLLCGLR